MYQISKMFSFEASHQLSGLPNDDAGNVHQCCRMHGHSYRAELVLSRSILDTHGFVVDYGDMKPFGDYIASTLDHQHLNMILHNNPTAEHLAEHLYEVAWKLFHDCKITVRVSETQKTWAEYTK